MIDNDTHNNIDHFLCSFGLILISSYESRKERTKRYSVACYKKDSKEMHYPVCNEDGTTPRGTGETYEDAVIDYCEQIQNSKKAFPRLADSYTERYEYETFDVPSLVK